MNTKAPFLAFSDQVRLKLGCVYRIGRDLKRLYKLYFGIRVIIERKMKDQSVQKGK